MHIIFTPLSIPLLHRFAGKYGRSPRVLLSRSLGSPPWRWSRTLAGGRCRCQSALACLGEAPSGCWRLGFLGGGRSGVGVGVCVGGSSMCWPVRGCGPSSVLYQACGVRVLCAPPPPHRCSPLHGPPWAPQL